MDGEFSFGDYLALEEFRSLKILMWVFGRDDDMVVKFHEDVSFRIGIRLLIKFYKVLV